MFKILMQYHANNFLLSANKGNKRNCWA